MSFPFDRYIEKKKEHVFSTFICETKENINKNNIVDTCRSLSMGAFNNHVDKMRGVV